MKQLIGKLSILIVLNFAGIAIAGEVSEASLKKLMLISGLQAQMAEIPGGILTGVEQSIEQGTDIPEPMLAKLYRSIDTSFAPEEILGFVTQELNKTVTEEQLQGLLNWYESDTGKLITKAEVEASSPAAYLEMTRMGETLFEDESRVIMAQTIARLTDSVDMVMALQMNTSIAVYAAVAMGLKPEEKVDLEAFRQQLGSQEEQMRDNIEQFVILTLLYSYRNIDNADMEKYLHFLGSEATRKFSHSVNAGLSRGLNHAIAKMAKSLYESYRKQA